MKRCPDCEEALDANGDCRCTRWCDECENYEQDCTCEETRDDE